MTDKVKLREKCKHFDKSAYSECIVNKLKLTEEYKSAHNIMIFYPLENEINLLKLLDDNSKNFYLPKIEQDTLVCCCYKNGDELCLSKFKTQEPKTQPCTTSTIDLVIVPALACDFDNYRLGYGGGYYDRFLKNFKGKKICCIPKELVFKTIYPEKHDIPMDLIITN